MDVTADEFTNRRKKSSRPNKSINDDGFSRVLKDGLKDDTSVFKSIQSNLNPPPPLPGVFVFDPPNHQAKVDSNFNHSSKQLFPTYNISQSVSNYSAPTHSAPYGKMQYSEPNMHEIHADQINFQTPVMYDYPLNPEQRGFKSLQPTVSNNIDSMIPSDTNVYQSLQPVPHNAFDMSSHSEPKVYQQLQTMSQNDLHMDSVKGTDSKSYHQLSPVYQPLNPVRPSDKMFRESKVFQQPRPVVPSYDSPQFVNSKLYQQLCQPSNTEVRKTYRPEVKTYQQLQPVTVSDFEHVRHPNTFSQCKSTNKASLSKSMQDYKNICVNNPPRSRVPIPTSYDINNVKSSNNFIETQQRSFQTSKPKIYLELRNPDVRHPSEAKSELHQRLSQCHAEGQNTSLPFTDCRSHSKSINKKNDEFKLPSPYKFNLPHGNASNKYMSEVGPNEFSSRGVRTPEKGQPSIVNKTFGSPNESRLASIPAKYFSGVSHMEPACSPTKPNKISLSLPKSPVCYGDLGAKSNPAVKYYPETSSVFSNEIGRSDHSFTGGVMPAGVTTFDSQLGVGTNSNSHSSNTILPVADSKPKESGSREITKTVSVSVKEKSLSSEPSEKVNFTNQNSGTLNQSKSEKSPKTYLQITENLTYSCNTSNTSGKQTLLKNNQNSPSILLNSIQHKSNVEDLTKKMFFSEGVKIDTPNSQFVKSLGLPVSENAVGNKQLISGAPTVIEIPSEDAKKNKEVFSTSTNIDHSLNKPVSVDVQSHEKNEPSEVIGTTEDQAQSKNDSSSTINNIINTKTLSNSLTQKMTLSKYDSDVIPGCVIKKYRKRKYHGLPIEKISQELIAETTRDCDIKNILESATQDVAAVAAKDYNKEIKQELQLSSHDVSSETAIDFNAETKLESQPLPQDIAAEPAKDCNTESKLESEPLSPNMAAKTSKGLEAESNLEPEALSLDMPAETAKDCNTESKLESEPLSPNMAAKTSKGLEAESNLEPEALSLDMPAETAKDCNTESKLESEPLSPNMAAKTSKDLKAESNLEPEALSLDMPAETAKDCNTESKLESEPLSPNVAAKTSKDLKAESNLEPEALSLDMPAETAKDCNTESKLELEPLSPNMAAKTSKDLKAESNLEPEPLSLDMPAETAKDCNTESKLELEPLSPNMAAKTSKGLEAESNLEPEALSLDMPAETAKDCNTESKLELEPLSPNVAAKTSKDLKAEPNLEPEPLPLDMAAETAKDLKRVMQLKLHPLPQDVAAVNAEIFNPESKLESKILLQDIAAETASDSKTKTKLESQPLSQDMDAERARDCNIETEIESPLTKTLNSLKEDTNSPSSNINKKSKHCKAKFSETLDSPPVKTKKKGNKEKCEIIKVSKPRKPYTRNKTLTPVLVKNSPIVEENMKNSSSNEECSSSKSQNFNEVDGRLVARVDTHSEGLSPPVDLKTILPKKRKYTKRSNTKEQLPENKRAPSTRKSLPGKYARYLEEEENYDRKSGKKQIKLEYIDPLEEGLISDDGDEVLFLGFDVPDEDDDTILGFDFGTDKDDQDPFSNFFSKLEANCVTVECDPRSLLQATANTTTCSQCDKACVSHMELVEHMQLHAAGQSRHTNSYVCVVCFRGFHTQQQLDRHFKWTHEGGKRFGCPLCSKRFTTSNYVKRHVESVHGEVDAVITFSCGECTLNFPTEKGLNLHDKKVHSSNRKKLMKTVQKKVEEAILFFCDECTLSFPTKQALKYHEDNVHSSNIKKVMEKVQIKVEEATVFSCSECTLNFSTEQALKSHADKVHSSNTKKLLGKVQIKVEEATVFSCGECTLNFPTEQALKSHEDKVHSSNTKKLLGKVQIKVEEATVFFCGECTLNFPTEKALKTHENKVHNKPLHQCDECLKYFVKFSNLKRHKLIHTRISQTFPCAYCNQTFNTKGLLHAHWPVHTDKKMFQCDVCGSEFTAPNSLKRHKVLHAGEKLFRCEICQRSFSLLSTLKTHLLIHTGARRFPCKLCHKTFNRRDVLNAHQWIHTGEKRFQCDVCLQKFRWRHAVKSHKLIYHSTEKPFACETCGKRFSHPDSFKKHAEVHADKIYYCQICLKAFSRPSTLKAHILIHTDLKPFFCDTCHRGFRSKSHLRNHFLVHTKEKPWLCKFCNKTYKDRNQLRRHKRLVHCTAFYKKMLSGIPEESKTVDNFDIISAAEDVLRENQGLSDESNIPFSENGTFEHFISLPLQNDHIKTEERVVDY